MKKNYRSAFDFDLILYDARDEEIPFPPYDFTIRMTTDDYRFFTAGQRGLELQGCIRSGDRIHIVVPAGHQLAPGMLHVEFIAELPNEIYPNGLQRVVRIEHADIELTLDTDDMPTCAEVDMRLPVIMGKTPVLGNIEITTNRSIYKLPVTGFLASRIGRPLPEDAFEITLTTDGSDLYFRSSRPLKENERICLLRKGKNRNRVNRWCTPADGKDHYQGFYKWHVAINDSSGSESVLLDENGRLSCNLSYKGSFGSLWSLKGTTSVPSACIHKHSRGYFLIPAQAERTAGILFGIAVYGTDGSGPRLYRKSNVAFFRSNIRMLRDAVDSLDEDSFAQWLTV